MQEITGDLIKMFKDGYFDVIAHGCNCFATMGAGIAKTIRDNFPEAVNADIEMNIGNGRKRLGNLTYCSPIIKEKKTLNYKSYIFNLYTQLLPGPDFRSPALEASLRKMVSTIDFLYEEEYINSGSRNKTEGRKDIKIGLPLIGCGIGGGKWDFVKKIIQRQLKDFNVTVVHFENEVIRKKRTPDIYRMNAFEIDELLKDYE